MDASSDVMETKIPRYVSDITINWLENVLGYSFDCHVVVHKVHKQNAVGPGDNFLTIVTRVSVDATVGGIRQDVSLIIKTAAEARKARMLLEVMSGFERECYVYREFLPYIGRNFNNHCFPLHYYGRQSGDVGVLVLEDLTSRGFTMRNKKECITLAEARSALVTLAKLHAQGHVLTSEDRFTFEVDLRRVETPIMQEFEKDCAKFIQSIIMNEFPELDIYVESIRHVFNRQSHLHFYYKHPKPGKFETIIHGDAWSNNMMFRYHEGSDPEVKLIDWQMTRKSSSVSDIAYFLYSSADTAFRARYSDHLLKLYLKTYTGEIKRYKPICEQDYSFEEIKQQYEDLKEYGFIIALTFARLIHDEVAENSLPINSDDNTDLGYDKSLSGYFKPILLEFIGNGLLYRGDN